MGVDMYLESSQNQANSATQVLQRQNVTYGNLQEALRAFAFSSEGLSGIAYDSAKAYCSQLLIPLTRACILLNEAIETATKSLPKTYTSTVDSVSLREDDLHQKIAQANRHIAYYQRLCNMEYYPDQPNYSFINSLNRQIAIQEEVRRQLEEKLRKLLAFHASSPNLFTTIESLYQAVNQGLSQARTSWNGETQTFVIPSRDDLMWVKQVNETWANRKTSFENTTQIEQDYQAVVKKVEKGEVLTEADVVVINAYAKRHPDVKPPKKVVDALDEYYYGFDDIPETLISKLIDMYEWGWATVGKVLDDANEIAIKKGKNLGRVLGAKLQPRDALGRFVKDTIKPRAWLSGKLKGMSNGTSKLIGHSAKFLGFGVSAFLEGADHYSKHKNVGRAVSYGAVGGAVAVGAGAVAGAIGAAFTLPLWGTLGVAIVAGTVASAGLKAAYENIKPVRDVIDGAGDLLNKAGGAVSDGFKSIGKAFSNPIGSLKGAFGW